MDIFGWINRIRGIINVERAYKDLDQALTQLRAYNDNPESVDKDQMDALVKESVGLAERLLALKGEKAWDGLYREMHEYLTKINMELHDYDQAEQHAQFVREYDRHEGDYLLRQIGAHKKGERLEDFDPSKVDEAEED